MFTRHSFTFLRKSLTAFVFLSYFSFVCDWPAHLLRFLDLTWVQFAAMFNIHCVPLRSPFWLDLSSHPSTPPIFLEHPLLGSGSMRATRVKAWNLWRGWWHVEHLVSMFIIALSVETSPLLWRQISDDMQTWRTRLGYCRTQSHSFTDIRDSESSVTLSFEITFKYKRVAER